MKKHIILSITILSLFISCKRSWLEIVPQGLLVAVTTDDYDKLMNDPLFYVSPSSGGWGEPQLMGDEVAAETPYFINKSPVRDALFQWLDSIYPTPAITPPAIKAHLTNMYPLNKIIEEVGDSKGGTDAQKRGIRAEALATRAWTIFQLANYYCKPYTAASATTDPGYPFTTKASVTNAEFQRGTLKGTYDFIIKDLTDALADIPAKQLVVTRMSRPAVEGLLGKVYLFMGRYDDALPLLKDALTHVAANGQTSLYNYNQTLGTGGSFLPIHAISGPNGPNLQLADMKQSVLSKIFYSGFFNGNQTGSDGLVLTPQAQALFGASDLRLLFYTNKNIDNSLNPGGRIRKYGQPYQTFSYTRYGLELAELYLLSAECKARTGDLGGAVLDVEMLRKNRMPVADATVPSAIAGNQTALVKFIIDERIREFAMEGYRWFDMRRLSVDPLYAGITFTHTMYNADGTTTVYTLRQPNRLVMKFPRLYVDANPEMQDNP
ncbi:RagB/SusD family nutrient uptake outer membrane protein [Chitinophaga sp. SYP-B3965]|uniref:RagB/SusD family nutrient uptake outer membrane protein n=1 Tax=Chitinophaga sp. SYP-B3965 TaxID=2663120 RepID=UPI001299E68D|nr:RagB/SusD family nutrient uptake outer membrane protein [Chitinophaga sp. SYP-B3965]MRG45741.1 RagB/SusD family nutrient uptake outer membrane protein [Chitinophaga sp. SYP-B3965]